MTERSALTKLATDELAMQEMVATPPSAQVRAHAIAAMTRELRDRTARARRLRIVGGVVAFAAAAAIAIVFVGKRGAKEARIHEKSSTNSVAVELYDPSGSVTLLHGAQPTSIASTTTLAIDDRVRVGQSGSASIALSTGTQVGLEANTDVVFSIASPTEVVTLNGGAATFHVAKLQGAERFIVRTSDAEVEVRGTKFRVSKVAADASCGEGTTTRVAVLEGVVVVRDGHGTTDVVAGTGWPVGCATSPVPTPPTAATAATTTNPMTASTSASTSTTSIATATATAANGKVAATSGAKATTSSVLSEQNDLFERAMKEKKEGSGVAALVDFDALLARFPNGPLAENAEVERMRLLQGSAKTTAAKAYLLHHPNGYARAEAQAIVDAAP